ncbi:MAG TPA: type II secretion system inner membrane protein GspF [Bdellovibrionota bacterium]|jgi:general secretion pathway protein F|nr:type II secretion system inner membrane protein GspF [Bdellovibrionota bacterium]
MANYQVEAKNPSGKTVMIFVEADSPRTARVKARSQGLTPISVAITDAATAEKNEEKQKMRLSVGSGINIQELSAMTRQLATLIKAHVPVVESLSAMVEQIESPKLRPVLITIRQHVREGKSLGDGFALFPKIFDRVFVNMVKAGESSGKLDVVLLRLADFAENRVRLKNKVQGAMVYPVVMIVVGLLVVSVIVVKVVPQITQIFVDMGQVLPLPTRIMIALSDFLGTYGIYVLFGLLFGGVVLERRVKTESGRESKDKFLLKVPVVGNLLRELVISRYARTLGTLLNSGVPMLTSLEITKNVVSSVPYERAIEDLAVQVSEGRALHKAMKQSGEFPPIVTHMVGVGEKSGELEDMLLNVATSYEQQVESRIGQLTALMEPLLIVVMAGAVGFIVISVLLPIFQMNQFGN